MTFFRDPPAASPAAGIQLTDHERTALGRIGPGVLAAFQRYLVRVPEILTAPLPEILAGLGRL